MTPPDPALVDQRIYLHGVSWQDYEALLAMRGDDGGLRVTYLEGELEIMTPSVTHEILKKRFARLLEAYAEDAEIQLEGYGSWTVRREEARRGAEADECYVVGAHDRETLVAPDIAIEVIWTSGGIEKLAVYRGLGIREVWFWQDGALQCFALRSPSSRGYEPIERSELLPGLDPELFACFMNSEDDQTAAVRAYRRALHSTS